MYDKLGKQAVKFAYRYLRWRYRREFRIGLGLAAVGIAVAGFLASRNVREG